MKTSFIIEIVITNIRFNSQYARKIILYHSKPGVWVRNVVMEMTAVMLNTKFIFLLVQAGDPLKMVIIQFCIGVIN